MAKDLDDGYTRIANEVLEDLARCKSLCVKSRVVLAIIRNTWGWKGHPKQRLLSQTYLAQATGAGLTQTKTAIHDLASDGIIFRDGSMTGYNKYWTKNCTPECNQIVSGDTTGGGRDSDQVAGIPTSRDSDQEVAGNPTSYLAGNPTTKKEKKENRKKIDRKVAAPDLFLTENMTNIATKAGVKTEDIEKVFEDFKGYYGDETHTPYKWAYAWRKWSENQNKFRKEDKNDGNREVFERAYAKFIKPVK